ncbi:MAG: DNA repair protein RecO [Candidatus Marinimicrobia bacterium]|nr:DNA repair protein RecO [Candidatus Neomarinimicrobiota bacterium]
MSILKTEAIVLRTHPYHESSSIVKLFTQKHGLATVIAKGARRIKSPFRGNLETFNQIEVIYYYKSTRDIQTLSSSELKRSFFKNIDDLEKLFIPYLIIELVEKIPTSEDDAEPVYNLIVDTFSSMETHPEHAELCLIKFLIEFSQLHGYKVEIIKCKNCGKKLKIAYFDTKSGECYCEECCYMVDDFIMISEKMINLINSLSKYPVTKETKYESKSDEIKTIEFLLKWLFFNIDIKLELKSFKVFSMISKRIGEAK